jgi:alpha-galactosidase
MERPGCLSPVEKKYHDPEIYHQDTVKFEILKASGYFVTESSCHMSEYTPYFRKRADWIHRIKTLNSWLKEDSGHYHVYCINREAQKLKNISKQLSREEPLKSSELMNVAPTSSIPSKPVSLG